MYVKKIMFYLQLIIFSRKFLTTFRNSTDYLNVVDNSIRNKCEDMPFK